MRRKKWKRDVSDDRSAIVTELTDLALGFNPLRLLASKSPGQTE